MGGVFVVRSGDLGFSVIVFTSVALCVLGILVLRRKMLGAELGGPNVSKYASSAILFFCWLLYISLASWNAMNNKNNVDAGLRPNCFFQELQRNVTHVTFPMFSIATSREHSRNIL